MIAFRRVEKTKGVSIDNVAIVRPATASIAWDQTVTIDGEVVAVKSPVAINFVVDEPTADKQFGNFVECREDNNTLAAPASIDLCAEQVN